MPTLSNQSITEYLINSKDVCEIQHNIPNKTGMSLCHFTILLSHSYELSPT